MATLVKSLCAVVVGTALVSSAFGQDQPQRPQNRQQRSDEPTANARGANEPEQNRENTLPIPAESKSETQHTWSAGGRSVHYTATAGNLLIRDDDNKPNGSIFYVAYTEDGADKNPTAVSDSTATHKASSSTESSPDLRSRQRLRKAILK